jgi:hypothetical protein
MQRYDLLAVLQATATKKIQLFFKHAALTPGPQQNP